MNGDTYRACLHSPGGAPEISRWRSHRKVHQRDEPRQGRRIDKDRRGSSHRTPLPGLKADSHRSGGSRHRARLRRPSGTSNTFGKGGPYTCRAQRLLVRVFMGRDGSPSGPICLLE